MKKELLAGHAVFPGDLHWLEEYDGAVKLVNLHAYGRVIAVGSIYAPAHEVKEEALEGVDRTGLTFGPTDSV